MVCSRSVSLLFTLLVGVYASTATDPIDSISTQGADILNRAKLTGQTVRQCSCSEQRVCVEEMKLQAKDCTVPCFQKFSSITSRPNDLKKCFDEKDNILEDFLTCFENRVEACVNDQHGPQIQKTDIRGIFKVTEKSIATQTNTFQTMIKPIKHILDATGDFALCVKDCFLEKNKSGFCFDRKGMLSSTCTAAVRGLSTTAQLSKINNVTIIGAGLMGSGIAQVSANAKLNVTVVDSNQSALEKAQQGIANSLKRVAKKKHADDAAAQTALVSSVLDRIKMSTNVSDSVKDADLVIEAIVENIDIKRKLFAEVEVAAKPTTLITTNTSSLRLADIGLNLKDKSRFGGLHFFNPVPMMKLLEVVRHTETSDATFNQLVDYGKTVGKTTVACKDTPGFIVNRLLVPYMFEALRLYERGDASMEDIDVAMKLGAGYPMGPFELSDYVGLDTCKFIMDGWHAQYPEEVAFTPSPLLNSLVDSGKNGRKSGEGFYKYK